MSDSLTAVYQFTKPQVGGSTNTWGGKLNTDLDLVDDLHARPRGRSFDATAGLGTVDLNNGLVQDLLISAPTTIAFANVPANPASGDSIWTRIILLLKNAGTNITWPGSVTWMSGVTPVFNTSGTDLVMLGTTDNGTTYQGVHLGVVDEPAKHTVPDIAAPSGTVIDLSVSKDFTVALTLDTVFQITNVTANRRRFVLTIVPDGATAHVVTWPGSVTWLGGRAPVFVAPLSAAPRVFDFYTPDVGTTWYAAERGHDLTQTNRKAATHVSVNAVTPIPSGTALTWGNGADIDESGFFAIGQPTRLTVPTGFNGGVLELVASAEWNPAGGNTGGALYLWVKKNGTTIIGFITAANLATGHGISHPYALQNTVFDHEPTVGDYYEVFVDNSSTVGQLTHADCWLRQV